MPNCVSKLLSSDWSLPRLPWPPSICNDSWLKHWIHVSLVSNRYILRAAVVKHPSAALLGLTQFWNVGALEKPTAMKPIIIRLHLVLIASRCVPGDAGKLNTSGCSSERVYLGLQGYCRLLWQCCFTLREGSRLQSFIFCHKASVASLSAGISVQAEMRLTDLALELFT